MKFLYLAGAAVAMVNGNLGQIGHNRLTKVEHFFEKFLGKEIQDDPQNPCCIQCTEPQEKYHSVDHTFNNCGEACMKPSNFSIYKIFEPGLEKSETNTPCADRNYTDYVNTPTHGVWPITMTLDLYAPTKDQVDAEAVVEENNEE